jgi:hypothetical protein
MEGEAENRDSEVRDYRYYTERAYQQWGSDPEDPTSRLDVADLIGSKGTTLEPSDDDWGSYREAGGKDEALEPNAEITYSASLFLYDADSGGGDDGMYEAGAAKILKLLADRAAERASKSFRETLDQLMEPVRTVGICYLYHELPREEIARRLTISVETVDFLAEVALSHLDQLVEFRSARERTRTRY